ncbi:SLC13 family permease [Fulvivirga lutea]|uniref:SLC13 family permease n=1 Tax=Fulvivirga lutea TaxID=2810512 RepID=A0A975A0U3_9BACT|nr:SLC13 family permease [Fulvivirga lutea]QSE97166.1 SLC13 family permease [Fulvivirga lutea]
MLPIDIQPYFVLGVIALLFTALYTEITKPAISFLFATLVLVIGGVIIPKDVLDGLANESIISIVLLILITAGFRSNFNVEGLLDSLFKKAKSYRYFLGLMMAKVAILSSFVNNTPVVVLMTPYVFDWGRKNKISPSKLLIPLSYATIFGGMITIIGTSTTLVLNGFLAKNGLVTINALHLFYIGGCITIFCILFILLIGNKLLPSRQDLIEKFELSKREYLIEKRLSQDSDLVGKTVKEGGLRNLKGVYLVEIVRKDQIISPVNPNEIIEPNDILIFAGNTDTIIDLTLSNVGIELPSNLEPSSGKNLQVVEGVISANNSLIGKTVKESNFRERYDAAVVAIHRNGEKLSGKIGRIKIKAGDVLLMYVGKSFHNKVDVYKDLYIISGDLKEIRNSKKTDTLKLVVITVVIVSLLFTQSYSLFTSLLIITTVMVGMKLITLQNIKRDLDINMIIILVLSLAIGQAMIKSGTGTIVAHQVVELLMPYGNIGLLIGMVLITTVLTSFVTNVGAIAISFPLALGIINDLGIEGAPFFLAIAFAASAAFITPIGYQTNLIVYGPGGYNFKDFLKIGVPVTCLYLAIVILGIALLYPQVFPI